MLVPETSRLLLTLIGRASHLLSAGATRAHSWTPGGRRGRQWCMARR